MLLQKIRNSNLFELSKYQWKPVPRYEVSNSKHLATLNLGIKRFAKLNLKQAKSRGKGSRKVSQEHRKQDETPICFFQDLRLAQRP